MKEKLAMLKGVVLIVALSSHLAAGNPEVQEFDAKVPPTKAEWQHFNKMSDSEAIKFWRFQVDRGTKRLRDWSWQWRMGWIKKCSSGLKDSLCKGILLDGLLDNAMVIRAEAATSIGKRFAGNATSELLVALQNAYVDPRNSRNGNPLYVYERILEALNNLSDARAAKIATRLAESHDDTKSYWSTISKR